jgi:hypothetical protein
MYYKGEYPTTSKILADYQKEPKYKGSVTFMCHILKNLNFKYKKCKDEHWFLIERNDIVAMRVKC